MIGERLFDLRKDKGMTQKELALMLKVSEFTISAYENDKSSPDHSALIKLSGIFNVSIDYLLGVIDTQLPPQNTVMQSDIVYLPATISDEDRKTITAFISFIESKYK